MYILSQQVLAKEKHILEQDTLFYWLRQSNLEKKFVFFSSLRTPDPISSWTAPDPSLVLGDPRLLINLPRNWHSQTSLISRLNTCQLLSWVQPICNSMDCILFILFMWFSRQEYWSGLPFPSPVDHILSDLSTMTRPSWVAPHSMA